MRISIVIHQNLVGIVNCFKWEAVAGYGRNIDKFASINPK